jgi:hypothetical protein
VEERQFQKEIAKGNRQQQQQQHTQDNLFSGQGK